jgi:hypothetical protein
MRGVAFPPDPAPLKDPHSSGFLVAIRPGLLGILHRHARARNQLFAGAVDGGVQIGNPL